MNLNHDNPNRLLAVLHQLRRPALCVVTFLATFAAIYYFSFWLRFEGPLGPVQMQWFATTVTWVVLIKLMIFFAFRVDQSLGRFVTFYDLIALVQAATVSMLLTVLVDRFFLAKPSIPRSVFLMDWGATIVMVGGIRAVVRIVYERNWKSLFSVANKVPVLIVGANEAGESLLRSIRRNEELGYHVVGFVGRDAHRVDTCIGGVPVVGTIDRICQLAERHGVREVLIAGDELSGRQIRTLVEETRHSAVNVKILPSYEQIISGRIAVQPREVSINDLLRREPVRLEMENLGQWIDGRTLLVTGSAGSIGAEICRQLLSFSPKRLVMVDRCETGQFFLAGELQRQGTDVTLDVQIADVLNEKRMRRILDRCRPDIVFHAAAYKHVPLMEASPDEAVRNIVSATRQLADLAVEYGVESFVLISTDKAVNPTSVMGTCKRVAELYVQSQAGSSACRFVTVRFGNVLDSAGSVVQVFRRQINRGGPVTVTDPRIKRYFMTIPEAAKLVIQAGAIGNGGEILVLDMGEPVRIVDLAADMIRLSGMEPDRDVEIEFTGLRPGEKLSEELYVHGETRLPTRHPKITVAAHRRRDPAVVVRSIERLLQLADDHPELLVGLLQQIVPEYGRPDESDRLAAA